MQYSRTFGPFSLWVCSSGSNLNPSSENLFYLILSYMWCSRTFSPFALWVCSSRINLNSSGENLIISYFILFVVLWDLQPLHLTKLLAVLMWYSRTFHIFALWEFNLILDVVLWDLQLIFLVKLLNFFLTDLFNFLKTHF